jgi:hypothetical protein
MCVWIYTLLLPRFVLIESAKAADRIRAAELCAGVKPGEIVIFDRAYVDFIHLGVLNEEGVFWVTRSKNRVAFGWSNDGPKQPMVGDKTMVDALAPAADTLERAAGEGLDMGSALEQAAQAAEEGARSTVSMRATKGRARSLGERSVGHQDAGATSFALMMKALSQSYRTAHRAPASRGGPGTPGRLERADDWTR